MVTDEISNTLPFLPAEQGWVPSSISISIAQPVLGCRLFDWIQKFSLHWEGQGEGTSHESQSRSASPPHSLNSDYFSFRRGAAAEEGFSDRVSSGDRPATESARVEAIRQALRERGYIEGQNIASEYRYAERKQ